jgi:glycosyltransferase involved in cell wall biosynthesis
MFTTDNRRRIRLAIVSPCPPQPSPAAARTDELCRTLRVVAPRVALSVWAIGPEDGPAPTAGDVPVAGVIAVEDPSAYRRTGQRLRRLGADAALLVFGQGTAGGPHGRHVLGLADELTQVGIPYLVALDDVRPSPRPDDADVVTALCRSAAGVVVLSDSARAAIVRNRLVAPGRIAVVPQGAPPELLLRPENATPGAGLPPELADLPTGRLLTTIGHLRPAKGAEVAVTALSIVLRRHPDVRYVVAGRTHVGQANVAGEWYRGFLARAADTLGVADRLHLVDSDLSRSALAALLHATSVYVASDLDRGRTAVGSLGYAVSAGCRVVTSDNPYARETVRADAGGLIVPPADPVALAGAVVRALDEPTQLPAPAPGGLSSISTAEQIAGLVSLVATPRSTLTRRSRAA